MKTKMKVFMYALFGVLVNVLAITFGGACMANATAGESGGTINPSGVQTVDFANEHDPGLRRKFIERKVVKVNPHASPLATIASHCRVIDSTSREVEYRTVSTLPIKTKAKSAILQSTNSKQGELQLDNNDIVVKNQTLLFPKIKGYNGATEVNMPFMAIAVDIASNGSPVIKPVNGKVVGGSMTLPDIPIGSVVVRAARAHAELDIQTSAFAALPEKRTQYLQYAAAQVEQSTLDKINATDSEADWEFSDVEELAIKDMKMSQDVSYLFGIMGKVVVGKEDVYTTGGIWYQAGREFVRGAGGGDTKWTTDDIVDLHKMSFTGNNGSPKKIMFCGSVCLANLMKARMPEGYTANANMVERFDLSFSELKSDFGTILVVMDETFDQFGMAECGIVVDPEYMDKYTIDGIGTVDLDLKKSGQRDVDARVIREISGLTLKNPNSHIRVTCKP